MKSLKNKTEKSTIQQLRDIRDKIGLEIQDMTFKQLKSYIKKNTTVHPTLFKRNVG